MSSKILDKSDTPDMMKLVASCESGHHVEELQKCIVWVLLCVAAAGDRRQANEDGRDVSGNVEGNSLRLLLKVKTLCRLGELSTNDVETEWEVVVSVLKQYWCPPSLQHMAETLDASTRKGGIRMVSTHLDRRVKLMEASDSLVEKLAFSTSKIRMRWLSSHKPSPGASMARSAKRFVHTEAHEKEGSIQGRSTQGRSTGSGRPCLSANVAELLFPWE